MTSPENPFVRQIRDAQAAADARRSKEAERQQRREAIRHLKFEIKEILFPHVVNQVRSDARDFTALMRNQRIRPGGGIYFTPEVIQAAAPQIGRMAGGDALTKNTSIGAWVLGSKGYARVGGGIQSHGATRCTYHASWDGLALDVNGNFWKFTSSYSEDMGWLEYVSPVGEPGPPRGRLEATRLATDHEVVNISDIDIDVGLDFDNQPPVTEFRSKLMEFATLK